MQGYDEGVVPKARSLWPVPGGHEFYAQSLRRLLRVCDDAVQIGVATESLVTAFPGVRSATSARRYIRLVGVSLDLVVIDGSKVSLTQVGRKFTETGDLDVLARQLKDRISGVTEILAMLEEQPHRIGVIHERLTEHGFAWKSDWQVRYRLRWMETAQLVHRRGYTDTDHTRQRYPEYVLKDY